MREYRTQVVTLLKRLLVIYAAYFLCRLAYLFVNYRYFSSSDSGELSLTFFYALRFDTFSIAVTNSLFILLSIFPFSLQSNLAFKRIMFWSYLLPNILGVLLNLIDVAYFPYIKKRSTSDLLFQAGGQTDLGRLLPQFISDFWFIIPIFIFILYVIVKGYKYTTPKAAIYGNNTNYLGKWSLFTILCLLTVLCIRGGFQRVPIDIIDAGKYAQKQNINLLLNTPFTLIKSLEKSGLSPLAFNFNNKSKQHYFNPITQFKNDTSIKRNLVVIILESFSKEYTALSGMQSYTPFLDSLRAHSLQFTNAFSNGDKSIEGIPAILSSMPSLMNNPLINSLYADNEYSSLASLLSEIGYTSAFFHGGFNGSMNFDSYAHHVGYQYYFGRDEYNNKEDFDGFWGIYDEPFLQYTVKKMNELPIPFHSAIFTLSSHHPYQIPEKYQGKFPKGDLEILESIGYADYSLKRFFQTASQQPWFHNTLFILCADHTGISNIPFYYSMVGHYTIPVLFYMPDNHLTGNYPYVFQHADILPSALELLGYTKPFFSFGKSYSDTTNRHVNYYANGVHYMVNDSFSFHYTNHQLSNVYAYKKDSLLTNNLLTKKRWNEEILRYQAFIETYHHSLIYNACTVK